MTLFIGYGFPLIYKKKEIEKKKKEYGLHGIVNIADILNSPYPNPELDKETEIK